VLENVEWEACLIEPRHDAELERDVRREFGVLPPAVAYFAPAPWLARALVAMETAATRHVRDTTSDLIGLVIAEDNSCRFCYAMQRTFLRLRGFTARRIRELEESRFEARLDPREALALEFARHVSRADSRLGEDRGRLRAVGWSEDAIDELAFIAATNTFANRIATMPALPVARLERMSRLPGLGLLGPIARRFLVGNRAERAPLTPAECAGPWSFLIEAFARSPAGRVFRRAIDEAGASPLLPRRSKLLVFAVVARTIGCTQSEREAIRLLLETGIDPDAIGETLRHLHSPRLEPSESAIAAFARETVRYRPSEIQRRARALEPALGSDALVELIGVSALANALCRLGMVTGGAPA
jgi:AhpD family alkylhydroperoxidase